MRFTRSRTVAASFSPSRLRVAMSSSSARRQSSAAMRRSVSSSAGASAITPGQRSTSAMRSGGASGNALRAASPSVLRRDKTSAFSLTTPSAASAASDSRQSTLPRDTRSAISSRSIGSCARSSSAMRN